MPRYEVIGDDTKYIVNTRIIEIELNRLIKNMQCNNIQVVPPLQMTR